MQNSYCNNCGKVGHVFHQCKAPITSFGLIAVGAHSNKIYNSKSDLGVIEGKREGVVGGTVGLSAAVPIGTASAYAHSRVSEADLRVITPTYLVIRRRDTLGYIDFMRGKYSIYNKDYIMNMIKQMTLQEKHRLHTSTFQELWEGLWGDGHIFEQYRSEESASRDKWTSLMAGVNSNLAGFYTLKDLVEESMQYEQWNEPEWGFPKGRRDYHESDIDCAIREFCEETGYTPNQIKILHNIAPYEEIFTGSNYKSYKHKYFIAFIDKDIVENEPNPQQSEVSKMEWKTADECLSCFRSYNLEKRRVIQNVDAMLKHVKIY